MTNLTNENFEDVVNNGKPVVVKISAHWCAACKTLAPLYNNVATNYEDNEVIFSEAYVEDSAIATFAKKNNVRGLPTIMVIKDGEVVNKFPAGHIKEIDKLKEKITETL